MAGKASLFAPRAGPSSAALSPPPGETGLGFTFRSHALLLHRFSKEQSQPCGTPCAGDLRPGRVWRPGARVREGGQRGKKPPRSFPSKDAPLHYSTSLCSGSVRGSKAHSWQSLLSCLLRAAARSTGRSSDEMF